MASAASPSRPSRRCSSGPCCAGSAGRRATRRCTASECGVDPASVHDDRVRHLDDRGAHAHRRGRRAQADGYYTAGYLVVESGTRGRTLLHRGARRVVAVPCSTIRPPVSRRRTRSRSRPGVMGSKHLQHEVRQHRPVRRLPPRAEREPVRRAPSDALVPRGPHLRRDLRRDGDPVGDLQSERRSRDATRGAEFPRPMTIPRRSPWCSGRRASG
jgi:hypothetical protein